MLTSLTRRALVDGSKRVANVYSFRLVAKTSAGYTYSTQLLVSRDLPADAREASYKAAAFALQIKHNAHVVVYWLDISLDEYLPMDSFPALSSEALTYARKWEKATHYERGIMNDAASMLYQPDNSFTQEVSRDSDRNLVLANLESLSDDMAALVQWAQEDEEYPVPTYTKEVWDADRLVKVWHSDKPKNRAA